MSANTVYLIYGSAYTSGTRHVMHVRNPTCRQKVLDVKKSAMLSAAWRSIQCLLYSVFGNAASLPWCCGLLHQKEVSFIVLLLWLGLVGLTALGLVLGAAICLALVIGSIGVPDVKWVELYFGNPTCRHSLNLYIHPQAVAVFKVLASSTGSSAVLS